MCTKHNITTNAYVYKNDVHRGLELYTSYRHFINKIG